ASNISYYPDGGTAGYSLNNGITATIKQNARQLPSNITYNQGGNLRFSEAYVYDADANLKTVTDLVNGKNNQTLTYDGLSRLASDTAPNNWGTEAYTYDPLNNIRLHAITGLTLSYNYDATNRLATMTEGTPTGAAFANFQYDARGNQTQSNVVFTSTPHTFDAKNQMLQIPGVATYSYDEAGRRIKKVLANGQVSYFFYSQAGQLMYEYNAATGQATDYLYLNGKLIARYVPGQNPTYLLTDRLGTPVRETDPSGALTQSFSYRPFGGLYSGVSQQQPGYTGHVYDPESSLSYMQARYYDPGEGRFLSTDPVGPAVGNIFNFNRFAYANNNPIVNMDPDGRCTETFLCGNGEGVGGVGNVVGMTFVMPGVGGGGGNGSGGHSNTSKSADSRSNASTQPMTRPARAADAILTLIGGTAFNEMKRPNHPTKIPDKLAHELFMINAAGMGVAASPGAIVVGGSAAPVLADEAVVVAGAAGRFGMQYGGRAIMAGCLAAACSGEEQPYQFAEQKQLLQEMYTGVSEAATDFYRVIIQSDPGK